MFKIIGLLLAGYVCYTVVAGKVLAKDGPGSRQVSRSDSPAYFWTVVAIYAGLSLALVFVF